MLARLVLVGVFIWACTLLIETWSGPRNCGWFSYDHECEMKAAKEQHRKKVSDIISKGLLQTQ
jgi:hypothetical protein